MQHLNQSEKNVLHILEQNCRLPANQIAKKVRLSPEGVIKIIKRLQQTGIITKFNTKYNYSLIGYGLYPVQIKLITRNKEIFHHIKQVISKHKSCAWYTFCEGEYDLLLSFKLLCEKDKTDMDQLLTKLSPYFLEKDVSIALLAFELSKSFVNDNQPRKLFPTFNHELLPYSLSDEELNIINVLKSNSKETVLTLTKTIDLSARVISTKIKKLEKKKLISGYKTKIDTAKLGFQPYILLISFGQYSESELKQFITYCQTKKGINYFVKQIGKYDIELTIDVQEIDELYQLLENLRSTFPFIKKITTLISKIVS